MLKTDMHTYITITRGKWYKKHRFRELLKVIDISITQSSRRCSFCYFGNWRSYSRGKITFFLFQYHELCHSLQSISLKWLHYNWLLHPLFLWCLYQYWCKWFYWLIIEEICLGRHIASSWITIPGITRIKEIFRR